MKPSNNITLTRGCGSFLFDSNDEQYLDMYAGVCVSNLGHNPPGWNELFSDLATKCVHTSNYFFNENEITLSNTLSQLVSESMPDAKVFFCNSGTEANEGALKMAILQNQIHSLDGNILAFTGGFHGRSIGSLSCTSSPTYREPFKLLMSNSVFFWDYNKTDGLEEFMKLNNIRIVIAEVVQGEGGVIPMTQKFGDMLRDLHFKHEFMLIIDEIQTGMFRCGTAFAHQSYGFKPDFVTLAKALGNGIPIGSVLMKRSVVVKPGLHGTTFGGNPFATGVANWVIQQMNSDQFMGHVNEQSEYLVSQLKHIQKQVPEHIIDIRHRGLLIGVEFDKTYPVSNIIEKLREHHILCITAGSNTLRICPPLNTTRENLVHFIDTLRIVLDVNIRPKLIWKISGDIDDESYIKLLTKMRGWHDTHDIAIVFGAGSAINAKLRENNIQIEYVKGQRKTCKDTMRIVSTVASEQQARLYKLTMDQNIDVGVTTKPVFTANKPLEEYGYVLEPEFADLTEVRNIWSQHKIALVGFLSHYNNEPYNSNADLGLSCLAIAADADYFAYSVASNKDILKKKAGETDFTEGFQMKMQEIQRVFKHNNHTKKIRAFIGTNDDLPSKPNSHLSSSLVLSNSNNFNVGLIGSRGFIGAEIAKYIEDNPRLVIHRFSLPDSPVLDNTNTSVIPLSDWGDINSHTEIDVWISSCPNNVLKSNIHLIDETIPLIDVSSDFRHQVGWEYGMCYINNTVNTHRISNAGCYSSAVIAGLFPLVKHAKSNNIEINSFITGISSYSGAGKNYLSKFPKLNNTVIPYQPLVHSQQEEMSKFLDTSISFVPIITDQFDRGIVCSIVVVSPTEFDIAQIKQVYSSEYNTNPFIKCAFEDEHTPTIEMVCGTTNIILANLSVSVDKKTLHIQSMIDNLTVGGGFSSYLNLCRYLNIPCVTSGVTLLSPPPTDNIENYDNYIESISFPNGFHSAMTNVPFIPQELGKKKVLQFTCLRMDKLSKWTATYTQNPICGNPVKIGRERLKHGLPIKALWINNKISNVGVAHGVADAEEICGKFAEEFSCNKENIIPLSTGIIGWQLPKDDMIDNVNHITHGDDTVAEMARAIMTTDSYPKAYKEFLSNGSSIVGVAKGAGMIEPNMATTIIVIMTDADMEQTFMNDVLKRVVNNTFNCISIDADTSTSDCCILISSGARSAVSESEFETKLTTLCTFLARQIVWNGEGIQHVIEVRVQHSPDNAISKLIGKNIVNSPLIKSAINGNDPNVGRIIGAMGRNVIGIDWSIVDVRIGEHYIMKSGSVIDWNINIEKIISDYLQDCQIYSGEHKPNFPVHNRSVVIEIDLKQGGTSLSIIGGDLSLDYVRINGDYRS